MVISLTAYQLFMGYLNPKFDSFFDYDYNYIWWGLVHSFNGLLVIQCQNLIYLQMFDDNFNYIWLGLVHSFNGLYGLSNAKIWVIYKYLIILIIFG